MATRFHETGVLKTAKEASEFLAKFDLEEMATRKTAKTSKRTVVEPHPGDRRYARRNKKGEFKKQVKVGRSLAADRRRKAKAKVPKGQGDRGDVEG